MEQIVPQERLTLLDAFLRWTEPARLEAIRAAERLHTVAEIAVIRRPLLCQLSELRSPLPFADPGDCTGYIAHRDAWHEALRDFSSKLERRALIMTGVERTADFNEKRCRIPGSYAHDLTFDLDANAAEIVGRRYGRIEVSRAGAPMPLLDFPEEPMPQTRRPPGRPKFPFDEFVDIAKSMPRANNNKEAASLLLERFGQVYRYKKIPAHRMVLDLVGEIYRCAGTAETPLNSLNVSRF